MLLKFKSITNSVVLIFIVSACNQSPRVVISADERENTETLSENPSVQHANPNQSFGDDLHSVVVQEVLPTTKYVYLRVTEGVEEYWVAATKQPANIGERYFFRGGLLKTNFESKEYNRVFEKIYLVASLVPEIHGQNSDGLNDKPSNSNKNEPSSTEKTIEKIKEIGSLQIAELVNNKDKYVGKTVQISGECAKINPNIMGRNWIHLKDGSKDDYDLVITSVDFVSIGDVVTMTGTVVLNKDFGAGYKYDLILENGIVVP